MSDQTALALPMEEFPSCLGAANGDHHIHYSDDIIQILRTHTEAWAAAMVYAQDNTNKALEALMRRRDAESGNSYYDYLTKRANMDTAVRESVLQEHRGLQIVSPLLLG